MAPANIHEIYQMLISTLRNKKSDHPEITYSSNGAEDTASWDDARYTISVSKRSDEEIKTHSAFKTRTRLEKKKKEWSETEKKLLNQVVWEGKKAYRFGY